jgi:hypothetical protein
MSESKNDHAGESELADETVPDERLAVHEAGHTVAIYLTGHYVELTATIVPGKGYRGRATGMEEEWSAEQAADWCFVAAGGYAGMRVTGQPEAIARIGTWADFEVVEHYADKWALPGLEHHLQLAVERMSPQQVVAAVRAVADALLEHQTVGGDWLERRIEYAMGEFGAQEWAEYEHLFFGSGGTVAGDTEDDSSGLAFEDEHPGAETGRGMDDEEWAACCQAVLTRREASAG